VLKFYFASIISVRATPLCEKRRIPILEDPKTCGSGSLTLEGGMVERKSHSWFIVGFASPPYNMPHRKNKEKSTADIPSVTADTSGEGRH
jgi:hypothetical protein